MATSTLTETFREKYGKQLFWLSLFADFLAVAIFFIDVLINIIHWFFTGETTSPAFSPGISIFGNVPRSDAVLLTGMLVISIIFMSIYLSFERSQSIGKRWPSYLGVGVSLLIGGGYFRLWMGEYWWVPVFLSLILISTIATFISFKIPTVSEKYRFWGIAIMVGLVMGFLFLIVTTNALKIIPGSPPVEVTAQTIPNVPQLPQPTKLPDPTATPLVDTYNPNGFISPDLSRDRWFPGINGLTNGTIGTVLNSEVNDSRWGRIISYDRWYTDPMKCDSADLAGVYIQVIFYQTPAGSGNFFDWANQGQGGELLSMIGSNAYLYSYYNLSEGGCSIDKVSINFLRNNVVTRTQFRFASGKIDSATMKNTAINIAQLIDLQLKANAH